MSIPSSNPVDLETGLNAAAMSTKPNKKATAEEDEEQEVVVKDPTLADLINYSSKVIFMVVLIAYIGIVVMYFKLDELWWQALLSAAIISPLFIMSLYYVPVIRDVFIKAYAMGPPDNNSSDLSSKLLAYEKM